MRQTLLYFALLCGWAFSGLSIGQPYPSKPIRIIHGFGGGVPLDTGARILAREMEKRMGQPFIVEPRPGANGSIGGKAVVGAQPDGYTLYYGPVMNFHPLFVKSNTIDASKELAAVSNILDGANAFIVRASLGVTSLQELIAYSKTNPGKLNAGSPSTAITLLLAVLRSRTGISPTVIPFKTGSPLAELLSGEVDLVATSPAAYMAHIKSGKLIALFSTKRISLLPGIPTAAEVGIPDFQASTNSGLWAPLGTARDVVRKLSAEAAAVVKNREVVDQLIQGVGQEPVGSTPEEQMRTFEADIKFWSDAMRLANYQPE
jgi:tripartite-type tricarboxylate transporter receptor subunit TctC